MAVIDGFLHNRREFMKMYWEEQATSQDIAHLKRSIEEAEILKSGMKLVLMNPAMDSDSKGIYEKAYTKLNGEIRYLKMVMGIAQKRTHS